MITEDINSLSREALVNIIKNLKKKYELEDVHILSAQIDHEDLLEAASDIIFVVDKDGNLIYRNSAWKTYFQPKGDEEIPMGRHYVNYLPMVEKERGASVFDSVIQEGFGIKEELMKTYDEKGMPLYFIISLSPIRDNNGRIMGLVGIMKNITERYLMEKRLKESSKNLEERIKEYIRQSEELKGLRDLNEEIINSAPIGIFILDPSGVVLSENPSLKTIMGRKPDETIAGENLFKHGGVSESILGELFEKCKNSKRTVKYVNASYVPIVGDRTLILNITMSPLMDENGIIKSIIVMVDDNTEQARVTDRMNRAERLSAIGFLASGIASELKIYINKMMMDLNFVENNVVENNPAYQYIQYLKDELDSIKNITEQLISLSSGTQREQKEICEINKAITMHPVDVMINRLRNDGFEISISLSDSNPTVFAAPSQIQQLFIQFLENAEEAMPDKGRIDISTDLIETENGKFSIFTVSDFGIGIPEENIQKIFQPFFTTKGKKATGLGLMITTTIVENMRGTMAVKSSPGEGTTVRIAIPSAEQQVQGKIEQ